MITVRIVLPYHLRNLARIAGSADEVSIPLPEHQPGDEVSLRAALDALEAAYPVLEGAIRDHSTKRRRAFLRFFACGQDLSHNSPDDPLPAAVARGEEPLLVVGAIAGGAAS